MRIASESAHNPTFRPNTAYILDNGFEEFITLCTQCWSHNPIERPNFQEIQQKLKQIIEKYKKEN